MLQRSVARSALPPLSFPRAVLHKSEASESRKQQYRAGWENLEFTFLRRMICNAKAAAPRCVQ